MGERVTYEDWLGWDEKVWHSKCNTLQYMADYEEVWHFRKSPYKRPKYVLIDEIPGTHWMREVEERDWNMFDQHIHNEENWVIVKPYLLADTVGRWIVMGNFFHKTTIWAGIFCLIGSFICPHLAYIRLSAGITSALSAFGFSMCKADPIFNYKIEKVPRELTRFPFKRWYPYAPVVFRRIPNLTFYRSISHRLMVLACLTCSYYCRRLSNIPCYCGFEILDI